jgi:hypothetical protein
MRAAHIVGYVGRMSEISSGGGLRRGGAERLRRPGGVERIYNEILMGRNGVRGSW